MTWPPAGSPFTNATTSKDHLAPALEDIIARVAATTYEAGGPDPITNLGIPTAGDFDFKIGTDAAVLIVDDSLTQGIPAATLKVVNPSSGDSWVEAGLAQSGLPAIQVKDSGTVVAVLGEQFIVLGDPNGVLWFSVDAAGNLNLTDGSANRLQCVASEGKLALNDGSSNPKVVIKDDGSGFSVFDLTDKCLLGLGETPDTASYNKIAGTLASLELDHYDSAGSGTLLSSLALADPGSNALVWLNADQSSRVTLKDDGSGLTLFDASGNHRITIIEDAMSPNLGFTLYEANGSDTAVEILDGVVNIYDGSGQTQHALDYAGARLGIQAGAVLQFSPNGDALIGVHGATPYGQDAYLAPLSTSVSITLLTDVAALINTTNTRVNAINAYLIARGWEASS